MHHVGGKGVEVDVSYDVAMTYDQYVVQVIFVSVLLEETHRFRQQFRVHPLLLGG